MQNSPPEIARRKFGDEWAISVERMSTVSFSQTLTAALKNGKDFQKTMLEQIAKDKVITDERDILIGRAKNEILKNIRAGTLISYGFEHPRRLDSEAVELPSDLWRGDLDWKSGTIKTSGLHLIEVRLIDAKSVHKIKSEWATQHVSPQKSVSLGRPTVRDEIELAFNTLVSADQINVSASAKSHFPLIREWLARNVD